MADEEKSRGQKDANDLGCLCNIHLVKAVLLGKCIIQLGFFQVLPPDHPGLGYFMTILCFCNTSNVSAAIASHANKILKPRKKCLVKSPRLFWRCCSKTEHPSPTSVGSFAMVSSLSAGTNLQISGCQNFSWD